MANVMPALLKISFYLQYFRECMLCACICSKRPEEGIRHLGAGVTGRPGWSLWSGLQARLEKSSPEDQERAWQLSALQPPVPYILSLNCGVLSSSISLVMTSNPVFWCKVDANEKINKEHIQCLCKEHDVS